MRVVVLGVLAACSAPAPDSPTREQVTKIATEACPSVLKPFFYSISKDGKTSYMLGTRHAGVALDKFPAKVREAFDTASVLVVESAFDEAPAPTPATTSLEAALGEDDWAAYRKLVGAQVADRANPGGIASGVASILLLYEDTSHALDRELQTRANAAKREVVALEDAAETAEIGTELLGKDNLKALLKAAKNRKMIAASTSHDLELYCNGEWEQGISYSPEQSARIEQSTVRRTLAWMDRLDLMLAENTGVFIAVGRAHITTDGGLIDLLRERGYALARNP